MSHWTVVSKSNVMEQGAWVQWGGEEYMTRKGFSVMVNNVYNHVFQSFIEYGSLFQNMLLRVKRLTSTLFGRNTGD